MHATLTKFQRLADIVRKVTLAPGPRLFPNGDVFGTLAVEMNRLLAGLPHHPDVRLDHGGREGCIRIAGQAAIYLRFGFHDGALLALMAPPLTGIELEPEAAALADDIAIALNQYASRHQLHGIPRRA